MSARIVETDAAPAGPIVWRQVGAPAAPPTSKDQTAANQHDQSPKTPDRDWQQEMEQKVRAAQQAGYNQGLNDGIAQGTERIQPVLSSLSGMLQELSLLKPKYRHDAEASAVGLALAVARRVLYRDIATDPEAILGLVKAGFEKINARETHRLRVSPEDLSGAPATGPSHRASRRHRTGGRPEARAWQRNFRDLSRTPGRVHGYPTTRDRPRFRGSHPEACPLRCLRTTFWRCANLRPTAGPEGSANWWGCWWKARARRRR